MNHTFRYMCSLSVGWLVASLAVSAAYHEMNGVNLLLSLLPLAMTVFCYICKLTALSYGIAVGTVVAAVIFFVRLSRYMLLDGMSVAAIVFFVMMTLFAVKLRGAEWGSSFGIKVPLALDYKEVWEKTHLFVSVLITGFLPIMFLLIFFWFGWGRFWSSTACVILPLSISAGYATIIGQPYVKKEKEELERQIQKEQGYR